MSGKTPRTPGTIQQTMSSRKQGDIFKLEKRRFGNYEVANILALKYANLASVFTQAFAKLIIKESIFCFFFISRIKISIILLATNHSSVVAMSYTMILEEQMYANWRKYFTAPRC